MFDRQFDDYVFGNREERDSEHLKKETQMLKFLDEAQKQQLLNYRKSLLHPELHSGGKIPSEIPQETATAQLKYNFNITPNASGRFLLVIDPSVQAAYLYNDSLVDGNGGGTLTSLNSFTQDSTIIDMWRLVSASLIIQYVGRLDATAGYLVGALTSNLSNATQTTFLTFSNIEDLQNRRVVNAIDGLKMIYSPFDTSQLDYATQTAYSSSTNTVKWKQMFVLYGEGLPNTACIRVDYVRNIEYIAKPAYREYIKHSLPTPVKFDANVIVDVKKKEVQTLEVF